MNDVTTTTGPDTLLPSLVRHPIWCEALRLHGDARIRHELTDDGYVVEVAPDHKLQEHEGRPLVLECGDGSFDWTVTVQLREMYEMVDGRQEISTTQVALTTADNTCVVTPCTSFLSAAEVRRLIQMLEHALRDLDLEARRASQVREISHLSP